MQKGKQQQRMQEGSGAQKTRLRCRFCDKTFLFPSVLIRHMRRHSNVKSRCKICKKGFPDRPSLNCHMRCHMNCNQPPESDSSELADNLHMPNPMQWLQPLEDSDSQETSQSLEAASHENPSGERREDVVAVNQNRPSTSMWPMRNRPAINLASTSEEVAAERPGLFQKDSVKRLLRQTLQGSKRYGQEHCRQEILCIEKPTGVQGEPVSSVGRECAEEQSGNLSGTSQCPSGSESDNQTALPTSPQGHFTLCSNGRALKCNYCSFMCRRTCGRMIKHLRVHGIRSRNQCKSCGMGFLNRLELQDHQKVCSQSSLAPQCSECGKTFSFRSLLRQHMNTHINKKPYKCKECPMTFNSAMLCQLHEEKQHQGPDVYLCHLCPEQFENSEDLDTHNDMHIIDKPFKCFFCSMTFSAFSVRFNHIRTAHRVNPSLNEKDETWLQPCRMRSVATSSSGMTCPPVSSPVMSMPIVVSVSSQSKRGSFSNPVDVPSLTHSQSGGGPSELTAGSPEMIGDGLNASGSGLVYMRKELNPEAENDDSGVNITGPSVLRSWSVSDSSDPMASAESVGCQVGNQLVFLKKEVSKNDSQRPDILTVGRLGGETGSLNQGTEGLRSQRPHQQFEPTSTAGETEALNPAEVFPVHCQHYSNEYPPRSNANHRLLDVGKVMASPSSDGSYGKNTDDTAANPESPCRATSTRRSLDGQDTLPGSHHCSYCDIAFGDPIMHYLHMGWHVTGDPWKCNGCGQDCMGKVDFFLHLYKAGHN